MEGSKQLLDEYIKIPLSLNFKANRVIPMQQVRLAALTPFATRPIGIHRGTQEPVS